MPASTPNPQAGKTLTNQICARPTCDRKLQRDTLTRYQGLCIHHARAAGLIKPLVPPFLAKVEIQRLYDHGWANKHIYIEAGIAPETINKIMHGGHEMTSQRTLDALRALPTLSPYRRAAWPLTRRLQSLRSIGHTSEEIAEYCGVTLRTIQHLHRGRTKWAPKALDDSIRAYFEKHKFDTPRRVSVAVSSQRLPLPMQWKDIDNPLEKWPQAPDPNGKHGDGSGQAPASRTFYANFDLVLNHVGNQHKVLKLLKINISTLKAWKERTAEKVTVNQYQRVKYHAKRLRNNPQASQKEAA